MNTFILEGAVDFSSGTARVGKTHTTCPLQTLQENHCAKRVSKAKDTNRITLVTAELVSALLNEGLSINAIADRLNCGRNTVIRRIAELKKIGVN